MIIKTYQKYLIKKFLTSFVIIFSIFACLIFTLNILEEINFLKSVDGGFSKAITLTFLNTPSILYEVSPFIFLISTQYFYINIQDRDEIASLRKFGLSNLKIIGTTSFVAFIFGILIILSFYSLSAKMKYFYYDIKNKYSIDNKYLAVINSNGLWIKDTINENINFINAESLKGDLLNNVSITVFSADFKLIKSIQSKEANVQSNDWVINKAEIFEKNNPKIIIDNYVFSSNFDTNKLNSLFDTLNSITFWSLINEDTKKTIFRFSPREIDYYINKLYSYPFLVTIMTILSSIIMITFKQNKSRLFYLSLGILSSVTIYYIIYFFNNLGASRQLSNFVSIWLPILFLAIITSIGLVKINEK